MVTGVLVPLFWKRTLTPEGIETVVKLKMPLGGNASVVSCVGEKAPSAPVLPLLNGAAETAPDKPNRQAKATLRKR